MLIHGAATLGFARYDLRTAARELSALGFRQVELSHMGSHARHFPCREADPQAVRRLLADHGLEPVAMNMSTHRMAGEQRVHFDFTDPADAREAVEQGRWYLESAHAMGVGIVTIPTARRALDEPRWRAVMEPACAAYRRLAETAGELGISVNLEVPHLFQMTDTIEHTQAIFAEIDHPALGATIDSSHWGIVGYDPFAFFEWLGPRLRHVHLRDSAGPDTRDGRQALELTPGRGTVDFVKLREALQQVGYAGRAMLDFEYKITDLDRIRDAYRQGLAHLARCGWEMLRD